MKKPEFITPRKESDRGGILCLPLAANLPNSDVMRAKYPDWKPMVCPRCGRDCYLPAGADGLRIKLGVEFMCTGCALGNMAAGSNKQKKPDGDRE